MMICFIHHFTYLSVLPLLMIKPSCTLILYLLETNKKKTILSESEVKLA